MLKRHLAKVALIGAVAFSASPAMALIHGQGLVGKRWFTMEGNGGEATFSSQAYSLAVHLDPIPLIPVAAGVSANMFNLNKDDLHADEAAGTTIDFEVIAWVPMVPVVTPYVKLGMPIYSAFAIDRTSGTAKEKGVYDVSGYSIDLGIKYSPIPLVSVILQAGKGMHKLEQSEFKVDGVEQAKDTTKFDLNSDAFMIGVEVGF